MPPEPADPAAGSIQPYGCLLACDAGATVALRHSRNLPAMLGLAGPINGQPLEVLLGRQAVHDLRNALTTAGDDPATVPGLRLAGNARFDVAVHRLGRTVIIEFEPAADAGDALPRARALIGRIRAVRDIDGLMARASRLLQAVFDYERVMVCRFEAGGAGKVVSEVKRPGLESLLGRDISASEIPAEAHALHPRSTLRIIADASSPGVPIDPERDEAGAPLDLSLAHLRGVSPAEAEQLRNMGAAASLSITVVLDDRLWGLIVCHHAAPRRLTMPERIAAELFGQFFSLQLHTLLQQRRLDAADEARRAPGGGSLPA